jgi:hypothetical protein
MIEKISRMENPSVQTIVEVNPDDLVNLARRLHLAANNAFPGQEILLQFTSGIVLKYDPKITSSNFASRSRTLTDISENELECLVAADEQEAFAEVAEPVKKDGSGPRS